MCEVCKVGCAPSVFRSREPEMAQDRPGMTPRWPRDGPRRPQDARDGPRWPQDGPKMVPRRPQGDPKMVLSCRRNANFAKLAMPSSVLSPSRPERAQSGPKMAPKWCQDGLNATPKLCSRVSKVQILLNWLCRHRSSLREGRSGRK